MLLVILMLMVFGWCVGVGDGDGVCLVLVRGEGLLRAGLGVVHASLTVQDHLRHGGFVGVKSVEDL